MSLNSGNELSPEDSSKSITKDVPAECAAFEKLLAIIARNLGEAKYEQFDAVATASLQKLVEFIDFDRGTIMMFLDEEQLVVTHCWAREGIPHPVGLVLEKDLWYARQVRRGRIVRISTAADWPVKASKDRKYINEWGLKSTVAIPLMIKQTIVGVLAFGTFHKERAWSPEIVSRLRLVGEVFALGMRRQQATEELRELMEQSSSRNERMRRVGLGLMHAEHKDRSRISELLHEDVMQILALAGMYMEKIQGADSDRQPGDIAHSKGLIQVVLEKLRNLAMELRPEMSSSGGFVAGLRWLANQIGQMHNLMVQIEVRGEFESLPEDVRFFLYSATSKLLDNVAAHAQRNQALLEIWRAGSQVLLAVSDEGVGFDVNTLETIPSEKFGLFSVREQTELFGGKFELTSSPGHGTRVALTVSDSSLSE